MKKLTYVYLIRHSEQLRINNEVDKNESQIANEKIVLSVEGERKAKEISQLADLNNIEVLWCSNYARAVATAKYIVDKNNIEINIDKDFNERKLRRYRKTKGVGRK